MRQKQDSFVIVEHIDAINTAMIKFVLMVNKQGQTRLASYFQWYPIQERVALEAEVNNEALAR